MPNERVSRPGPTAVPAPTPTGSRPAAAPAPTPTSPDQFGRPAPDRAGQARRLGSHSDTEWWGGRPLSEARNAHRTNTKEQFNDALHSSANWFEGDVRKEINSDRMEMRHDEGHESGDNMTLREWLEAGVKTGRGLKLDVKEPEHMNEIMDEVERAGVPQERLMINLGYGAFEKWGPEIRRRFPDALLALNPPTSGTIGKKEAEQLVDQARRLGGPVTFEAHYDQLSDEAIATLKPHGTISVWGDGVGDVRGITEQLRDRGVDGMIDLADHHPGVGDAVDKAYNWAKTKLDKIF
ncbi:MAG TPA: DUF2181 domain-containing protein [Myxococcales bacterium]|nr:DUF2181 domain-containing protein [Myxococcales bacterium]